MSVTNSNRSVQRDNTRPSSLYHAPPLNHVHEFDPSSPLNANMFNNSNDTNLHYRGSSMDDPSLGQIVQAVYFVDVLERVRKFPFQEWGSSRYPNDPPRFADITGSVARPLEKVTDELPPTCEWLTEWEVVEDDDPEAGDAIAISPASRSPTTAGDKDRHSFPAVQTIRCRRDADGWRYGKTFKECYYEEQKGLSCRSRIHRRVFRFTGNTVGSAESFHPLFRCLIADERFGQQPQITFEMLRDGAGSDGGNSEGWAGGVRPRQGSRASSAASSVATVAENALLFNYLPDEMSEVCMNQDCGKKFNALRRRHHCRACGLIYCGNCSPKRKDFDNVRICDPCNTLGKHQKEEIGAAVALRKEEERHRAKEQEEAHDQEVKSGAHMLKFQIQQNQNLEPVVRSRLAESEDKSLTMRVVQWYNELLGDDDPQVRAALLMDKWEAARRVGGRSCVATIHVKQGLGIDANNEPSTFVRLFHESRPKEEYSSSVVKKCADPQYDFNISWHIYDDSKAFDIAVMMDRTLGKPKELAMARFVPTRELVRRRVDGETYTEFGEEAVQLMAPRGEASLPAKLVIAWSMEYRNTMEESDLEFCPGCSKVLPYACSCADKDDLVKERLIREEEEAIAQALVTSERLHRKHYQCDPPRDRYGLSQGAEAYNIYRMALDGMMKRSADFYEAMAAQQQQQQRSNPRGGGLLSYMGLHNTANGSLFGNAAPSSPTTAASTSSPPPVRANVMVLSRKAQGIPSGPSPPSPSAEAAPGPPCGDALSQTMPPASAPPAKDADEAVPAVHSFYGSEGNNGSCCDRELNVLSPTNPPSGVLSPADPPREEGAGRPEPLSPIIRRNPNASSSSNRPDVRRPRRGVQRKAEGGCCTVQ